MGSGPAGEANDRNRAASQAGRKQGGRAAHGLCAETRGIDGFNAGLRSSLLALVCAGKARVNGGPHGDKEHMRGA